MLKRIAGSSLVYGLGDLTSRLVVFAAMPVFTAILAPAEFGKLTLLLTAGSLIGAMGSLGINNAVQRFYFEEQDVEGRRRLATTGWMLQACALALAFAVASVAAACLLPLLAADYGITGGALMLALGGAVFAPLVQYGLDLYRLEFRPVAFSVVQALRGGVATLAAVALVAWAGYGIAGILLANLLCFGTLAGFLMLAARRRYGWRGTRGEARRLLAYGWPFVPVALMGWAQSSVDRWLISGLSGLPATGTYAVASTFAGILGFAVAAFAQAWSPLALKLRSDDPAGYREVFAAIWPLWGYGLVVLASALMLFAPEIIRFLTGPAYHGAIPVLIVLVASAALAGTTQMTALGISLSCRTGIFAWASAGALVVSIAIGLALIPWLGAMGAAIGTLLSQLILTSVYAAWSQRLHPLPLRWVPLLLLGACGAVLLVAALLVARLEWSWWHPLAKSAVVLVVAAALWCCLGVRRRLHSLAVITGK